MPVDSRVLEVVSLTVVGILGVTHDPQIQAKYQYPLSLMEELIQEFAPDVICGEVHPRSWRLYVETGNPDGLLGEVQQEYPRVIYPFCERQGVTFVPVNWFEEDVFQAGPFDRFDAKTRQHLEQEWQAWNNKQMATWNHGRIPFNSLAYDGLTEGLYAWLEAINPAVQNIQWNARHYIMMARVESAVANHLGKRILCIHGADHNYWYHRVLRERSDIELIYPLR